MSDDLVKRARHNAKADMPHYASVGLIEEMAAHIEELEANLASVVATWKGVVLMKIFLTLIETLLFSLVMILMIIFLGVLT